MKQPESWIPGQANALVRRLSTILVSRKLMMVAAESCTGGLISAVCTDYPGSSAWFWGGFIVYANQAKNLLGVSSSLIERHGAVSEAVVAAMATAAAIKSGVPVSVAVSGIAGPDGGSIDKPVGTICFGWHIMSKEITETVHYSGDRQQIRFYAIEHSLSNTIKLL